MAEPANVPARWSDRVEKGLYAVGIALGGVLAVLTALQHPDNQNEWARIQPWWATAPARSTC